MFHFGYQRWTYKGHTCTIEPEYYEDNIKLWHTVVTPDGKELFADISPYEGDPKVVEMWIDAGYPKRISCGPLNREDLEEIGPMDKLTALVRFGIVAEEEGEEKLSKN